MNFETVIGIEIHCELKTKSKMFSSAANAFDAEPNTNVHVNDLAFPGIMPVLNKKAVEYAIMASTALNMEIDSYVCFDRKNYFYPDLPKGFQITQDKRPIGKEGYIEIEVDGTTKRIGIERLHMEEDTAKQLHFQDYTLINYNRCGVPLIEIVSKPEIRNGKEAAAYVEKLRSLLLYTGVSDVKMEEGSMRCDVNVSIRPYGSKKFGVKTEVKNLNSVSNVMKAVDFEVERQKKLLLSGGVVEQETRRFDELTKQTVLMRKKTDAVDYKYFTEPNIAPIQLDEDWIKEVQASIPELPDVRYKRYTEKLGLSSYDAQVIIANRDIAFYFDEVVNACGYAKSAANWIMSNLTAHLNKNNLEIKDAKLPAKNLGKLISMIEEGKINSKQGKQVFEIMLNEEKDPEAIAKEKNMMQISDESVILAMVNEVLDANPKAIEDIKNGRTNLVGFLVGQVIKKSLGKANPGIVSKLVNKELQDR